MIRGWYTAASGMRAQQWRLDAVANNLANVNTDGYKRDQAAFKAFPELLLRRQRDDAMQQVPFGSADAAPVVGVLGTGVELNELFTVFDQGSLKEGGGFDMALDGRGFFTVGTPQGERFTRNGSFQLGKEGILEKKEGFPVLGENGAIRTSGKGFVVDKDGAVWEEAGEGESRFVDRLRLVDFDLDRYLERQGSSLYKETDASGPARVLERGERPKVAQGFTEAANVEPVREMVEMIEVNRAYEANQKVIQTHDSMLGVLLNQTAKVS